MLPYPLPFFIGGNSSSVQNAMWSHHIISEDRITTVCIVPGSSQCILKHLFSDLYGLKKKIKSNLIFTSLQCFSAKKDASCLKIRLNAQINTGAHNELEKNKNCIYYTYIWYCSILRNHCYKWYSNSNLFGFLKFFLSYIATSIKQAECSLQNLKLLLHDNFVSGLEPVPDRNAFSLLSSDSFATEYQR